MSLLLDALRKSQDRRRLGQAPGLELPAQSGPGRRRRVRRARLLWFVPVLAVLGLAAAGTWWTLERAPAPVVEPETPGAAVTLEPPAAAARTEPEPAAPPPVAEAPEARAATELPADTGVTPALSEPEGPPEPAPAVVEPAPAAVPEPIESTAPAVAAGDEEIAGEAVGEEVAQAAPEPAPERFRPAAPEYVDRWDLPTAIRQELPELRLTIHVFSSDPSERFVLVNGERWGEGDEVAPGVRLYEIRREGAVMEFRDYRFLLE